MAKDLASNPVKPAPRTASQTTMGNANAMAQTQAMAKPAARVAPANQQAVTAKAAAAQNAAMEQDQEEEYEEASPGVSRFFLFTTVPSWAVSGAVHAVVVIMLALWTYQNEVTQRREIVAKPYEDAEEIVEFNDNLDMQTPLDVNATASEVTSPVAMASEIVIENDISSANDLDAAPVAVELSDIGTETAPRNDLAKSVGAFSGTGVEGRGAAARAGLVASGGGSKESEEAVQRALKWFSQHQYADGSWSFDHQAGGSCQGKCNHPGKLENGRNGATGMALLPFLGAGQTHREGAYKENVKAGLYYLVTHMKNNKVNGGGDLADGGTMYSHGICSIVLCEAYAMTHDRELMAPAQAAINHIVYAQDPVGGGWRYGPRQPGDTSAVGWQLMALKSAHMAYLNVPPQTIQGAIRFLDSVQQDSGSKYGYTSPGAGQATTAVGLLSRMYLGWKKENAALERGVEYMSKLGFSHRNFYYSYYATQIMRHWEGDVWTKWNEQMRDPLIAKQEKSGHLSGSWMIEGGDHGADRGGRHYCTSMATMMLEVYYRHMPIYKKNASEEDFPLN